MFYIRVSYFLFVFCCLTFCNYAQIKTPAHVNGKSIKDSTEVRQLIATAKKYENSLPDSAIYYYEKAGLLAQRIKYKKGISDYFSGYIRFLNHKAQFEEGLTLARQHVALSEKNNDSLQLMTACNEVANEEQYFGDFQSATQFYLQALKLAGRLHQQRMQRLINNNLSSVFISLKDYKTAYRYSDNAYQLARDAHDTTVMGDCLINMGISEIHQTHYDEALNNFSEAEKIGYREPDMTLVADALSDKGLVYYDLQEFQKSEEQYHKQENIAVKYDLPFEQLYALFELAVLKKEKGDFGGAEKLASRAISIGEDLNTKDELAEMYDTMAVIKLKMGKLAEAMAFKNKFEAMKDTLTNAQVQTNIHHLELQYRSAQKDKEIAQQALKIERTNSALQRKNTLIWVILAGLLALITILVLSYRSYRHKQKLSRQQLLTLQKEHEVNTLKAKMQAREEERNRIGKEMHDDIGSALTTILYHSEELNNNANGKNSKALKGITETATSVMDKMNEIIWSMNSDYDTVDDFIAYTRQHSGEYLQNHNLDYHFEIPTEIPDLHLTGEQRRNIYLVIKEALHNVVKHACASKVCISFQIKNNLLILIKDNGKGTNNESGKRFGNGLKNMRQRMESIGGTFKMICNEGTCIQLTCPVEANKKIV
ncbi:MAG TPA: ATP-binding protein [Hanamia sp.]|nr:ATP-binding protein [Hanamia sp.]